MDRASAAVAASPAAASVPPKIFRLAAAVALVLAAGFARAQLPIPASTQFDVTGVIQEAILDPACTADPHCGGTLSVNGHTIVVPKEIVVMFPANALTWQELFAQAPLPYGLATATGVPMSGMAASDLPTPLTNYEAHVIGNRVLGGPAGADLYIAALIFVSQQSLNSGSGFISFIDYALGELRVGGVLDDPNCAQGGTPLTNPLCSGARVRINDPAGRYGRVMSPDVRFTVDADNPTIMAGTGFPMCLPRTDPAVADDALCPRAQRPVLSAGPPVVYLPSVQMNDPTNPGLVGVAPDALKQVPFEVGDFINFAGTLVTDSASAPTAGPWPGKPNTYVSAHTIVNNIAIYTWPGTDPAYVMTEVTIIGTGGLTVLGAGEAAIRTRFEGMTTDPSRLIDLYGIDTDPLTGATTDRYWGTIAADPGAPVGAVKGRWRFRPPCLAFGSVPTKPDKQCVMNDSGTFLPPTREMRAVIRGGFTAPIAPTSPTAANGIVYGQYHAPIFEYIFPENIPGTPIVPNNFNTIPFLTLGGYTTSGGTLVGQLNPWPDITVPPPSCSLPSVNTGGPYTVAAGGLLQLAGIGTGGTGAGTTPTLVWTVSSGSLDNPAIYDPLFDAAGATSPVTATLTVSACGQSVTASTTITINAAGAPTVDHVSPINVMSGARGSLALGGTDPNLPAQPLTFAVAQAPSLTGGPLLSSPLVTSTGTSSATYSFTAPTLPLGNVSPVLVDLTITATNAGGTVSAPEFTSVQVLPLADVVTVTFAQYRTGKQRLDLTATSSVVSPQVVLKLQPYLTVTGTMFDPSTIGNTLTNNGGGLYSMTIVGVPEPAVPPAAPIFVKSNLNGQNVTGASITVRQ